MVFFPQRLAYALCLCSCCKEPEVQHVIATLKDVINFVNDSALRLEQFKRVQVELANNETDSESNDDNEDDLPISKPDIRKLKKLCETRWLYRNSALQRFVSLYDVVVTFLREMAASRGSSSASANVLYNTVTTSRFIVSLIITEHILGATQTASYLLQRKDCDVIMAYDMIQQCVATLKAVRANADENFKELFEAATELADKQDVVITIPRIVAKKQQHRRNVEASTPEEYYRRGLFIPVLESFIQELSDRFNTLSSHAVKIAAIIPKKVHGKNVEQIWKEIKGSVDMYKNDLSCDNALNFKMELTGWINFWNTQSAIDPLPKTVLETILSIESIEFKFPLIYKLLHIFVTIPVTTATVERSFSTLRHIKTDKRSTMGEDRLVGLTLLYIYKYEYAHKDKFDFQKIADQYLLNSRRKAC